jgi:thiamine kinase-like enzyme
MSVDSRIRNVLSKSLRHEFSASGDIVTLKRVRSDYSSSYQIEHVQVVFENGDSLSLIYKNLSRNNILREARETRHPFLYNPEREIEVYRSILAQCDLGTARLYGSVIDEQADYYWLFIEKLPGLELYQLGEFETWLQAARWLATFHDLFNGRGKELESRAPLLRYDRSYYERWPLRAQSFLQDQSPTVRKSINRLVGNYDQIIDRLLVLPTTLLHGDFFASNILVQQLEAGLRICPVDWDMAALGPGFIDLAALISGNWTENQKAALIQAYMETLQPDGKLPQNLDEQIAQITCCQLHLTMQWLGWSANWSPPEEHKQDWLEQALILADRLEL